MSGRASEEGGGAGLIYLTLFVYVRKILEATESDANYKYIYNII